MSAQPVSFAPAFTPKDARAAGQSYQHLAHVVDRLLNHILNGLEEKTAQKYFKASVFSTIHSLHGFFNGRDLKKKDLIVSAQFVAPHFHYHGNPVNAGQFIGRHLDALADAEFACGLRLIEIKRADNVTLLYPHYKAHPLLDAAEWLYLQARSNPDYWKNPSAAITENLLTAAAAKLPPIPKEEIAKWLADIERHENKPDMEAGDEKIDAVLKGRWTKWEKKYEEILIAEMDTGGKNPLFVYEKLAEQLKKIASELYERKCREINKQWKGTGNDWIGDDDTDEKTNGYNNALHVERQKVPVADVSEEATPLKNDGGSEAVASEKPGNSAVNDEGTEADALLKWALTWAGVGIPIVPMHQVFDGICSCRAGSECRSAGKHPRWHKTDLPNGAENATTDEEMIRRWWKRWPMSNIGGAMGGTLRWLAVDVDPRNGGSTSFHDLTVAHGEEWLETYQHKTGSGGDHLFFTVPEGIEFTKGKLAKGIDLKWTNGLVVLPPSGHVSGGEYRVSKVADVMIAPDWLLEELTRPDDVEPSVVVDFQERRASSGCYGTRIFHEGERDNGIRDVARGRWANGWAESEGDLINQLLEVNATRCVPPLEESVVIEKARRTARKFARGERKQEVTA